MNNSYNFIKADYLQRTRSYAFLITLAITVYAAYSFVPPPSAQYTTLNITGYKGVYNSAWFGHVSAMMTTIMLSLCGFFLVNTGIKKDIDTEVGLIIATAPITNYRYLLSKLLSNFLILLTISGIALIVSIMVFFLRNEEYPFVLSYFLLPYLFIVIPSIFVVAAVAIIAEVFLGTKQVLQYCLYILLFGVILGGASNMGNNFMATILDVFGVREITSSIKDKINIEFNESIKGVSMGYTFNPKTGFKSFEWNGITWTGLFLFSRIFWLGFSFLIVYLSSFFFHRFDFNQPYRNRKKGEDLKETNEPSSIGSITLNKSLLPPIVHSYGIFPFIKTELLLLVRQGSKWLRIISIGLWLSLFFVPLSVAHAYLLPILLFLQVIRLSDLVTKEKTNGLHFFTFSAYKPLHRILSAQIIAGILLTFTATVPVILRYLIVLEYHSIFNIINGSILIIALSACMGIISGGKKLFEIAFFVLTYAVLNRLALLDYLGAMPSEQHAVYSILILTVSIGLIVISYIVRNYQMSNL